MPGAILILGKRAYYISEPAGLTIQPAAVDPEDTETLADLIVAAVRAANAEAQQAAADTMGPLAGGLPGLPGLGM